MSLGVSMEDWGAVRARCARDIGRVGDWDGADHYEDCPAIPHVDHECDCPVIEDDDDDTADECADRCEGKAEEVCDCYLGLMRALRADIRAALERVEQGDDALAVLNHCAEAMTGLACEHGVTDGTPAMMWPEAILCAVKHAKALRQREADLADQVDYWMGKELALRQRVEELERDYAEVQDISVSESAGRRKAEKRAEELEAKLAVWEKAESLPDCPACAALAAAKGE